MTRLGPPPPKLDRKNDRQVNVELTRDRDARMSVMKINTGENKYSEEINQLKVVLSDAVRFVPCQTTLANVVEYFQTELLYQPPGSKGAAVLNTAISRLEMAFRKRILPGETLDDMALQFFDTIVMEIQNRKAEYKKVMAQNEEISKAITAVEEHHQFLRVRCSCYQEVLDDLVMKSVLARNTHVASVNKADQKMVKTDHSSLVEMRVVIRILPEFADYQRHIDNGLKVKYQFTQEQKLGSIISITVKAKKGFMSLPVPVPKILIDVAALHNSDDLTISYPETEPFVEMNRNLLLHFLHTNFQFRNVQVR
jgi:hypothetical protein